MPNEPVAYWDLFGSSLDVDGGLMAIGARFNDEVGENAGAVYLFERSEDDSWREHSKFLPTSASAGWFGSSVALDGDWLAIVSDRGSSSVSIYHRSSLGDWVSSQEIPISGAQQVSLDNGWLAITYSNKVRLFELSEGIWLERQVLSPGSDLFVGAAVSLRNRHLVIGDPGEDVGGGIRGSVYLWELNDLGVWIDKKTFNSSRPNDQEYLGQSVDVSADGTRVVAGGADNVYSFDLQADDSWIETKIPAFSSFIRLFSNSSFGANVSLSGDRLLINSRSFDFPWAWVVDCQPDGSWKQTWEGNLEGPPFMGILENDIIYKSGNASIHVIPVPEIEAPSPTASVVGDNIQLSWPEVPSAEGYRVYHGFRTGELELIADVTTTTWTHPNPERGLRHIYRVAIAAEDQTTGRYSEPVIVDLTYGGFYSAELPLPPGVSSQIYSVGFDGNKAIVAWNNSVSLPGFEARVLIFERTPNSDWQLKADFEDSSISFGEGTQSTVIEGNEAVASGWDQSTGERIFRSYVRSPSGIWSSEGDLVKPAGSTYAFGSNLALKSGLLLVGDTADAGGRVHTYERQGEAWSHVGSITAENDLTDWFFGDYLLFQEGRLAVSQIDGPNRYQANRMHIFRREADAWIPEGEIEVPTPTQFSGFSPYAAAFSNEHLFLLDDSQGVVVYKWNGQAWEFASIFPQPESSGRGNGLGDLLQVEGDLVIVGHESRELLIYRPSTTGAWELAAELKPHAAESRKTNVLLSGERALVKNLDGIEIFENVDYFRIQEGATASALNGDSLVEWPAATDADSYRIKRGLTLDTLAPLPNLPASTQATESFLDSSAPAGTMSVYQIGSSAGTVVVEHLYNSPKVMNPLYGDASDGLTTQVIWPGPYPSIVGWEFGKIVKWAGSQAIISAPGSGSFDDLQGLVQVFEMNEDGIWELGQTISPPEDISGQGFGGLVETNGDQMVIGSTALRSTMSKLHLYLRDASGEWIYAFSIESSWNATIALHQNWLAIGRQSSSNATGSVSLYPRTEDGWGDPLQISQPDPQSNDYFGSDLLWDGDRLIVSASGRTAPNGANGEIFVFERDELDEWSVIQNLYVEQTEAGGLGGSMACSGKHLVIGRSSVSYFTRFETPLAWVFRRDDLASPWVADGPLGSGLSSVDGSVVVTVRDDVAAVSSRSFRAGEKHGGAMLFVREEGSWNNKGLIACPEPSVSDGFGASLDFSPEGHLMVGSANGTSFEDGPGAVYIVRNPETLSLPLHEPEVQWDPVSTELTWSESSAASGYFVTSGFKSLRLSLQSEKYLAGSAGPTSFPEGWTSEAQVHVEYFNYLIDVTTESGRINNPAADGSLSEILEIPQGTDIEDFGKWADWQGSKVFVTGQSALGGNTSSHAYSQNESTSWTFDGLRAGLVQPDETLVNVLPVSENQLFLVVESEGVLRIRLLNQTEIGWDVVDELQASDVEDYGGFGASMGFHSNLLIIGAPDDDQGGTDAGAIYTFQLDGSDLVQHTMVFGEEGDQLGIAVAVTSESLFAGMPGRDDSTGGVMTWRRSQFGLEAEQEILPPESYVNSRFGFALDASERTLVVSAPGSHSSTFFAEPIRMYVEGFDQVWREQPGFLPNQIDPNGSVEIADNRVTFAPDSNGLQAQVLTRNWDGTWVSGQALDLPHTSDEVESFALSGNRLISTGVLYSADSWFPGSSSNIDLNFVMVTHLPDATSDLNVLISGSQGWFPGETNPEIIGLEADPDLDGIPNGIEVRLGRWDPELFIPMPLDPSRHDSLPSPKVYHSVGGQVFEWSFLVRTSDVFGDSEIVAEWNDTLEHSRWSGGGIEYEWVPYNSEWSTLTVRRISTASRVFLRLKVQSVADE